LLGLGNVVITGKYKAEQLPGLIAQSRGRLALFLPSWPETYSYTLSEAAKYGFIPLVPDIGAPAERVRAAGYGVVFGFPANAAEVLEVIGQIGAGTRPAFAPGAVPAALYPTAEDIKLTLASLGLPAESRKSAASRPLARTR
jgi:hypothetical protein